MLRFCLTITTFLALANIACRDKWIDSGLVYVKYVPSTSVDRNPQPHHSIWHLRLLLFVGVFLSLSVNNFSTVYSVIQWYTNDVLNSLKSFSICILLMSSIFMVSISKMYVNTRWFTIWYTDSLIWWEDNFSTSFIM